VSENFYVEFNKEVLADILTEGVRREEFNPILLIIGIF